MLVLKQKIQILLLADNLQEKNVWAIAGCLLYLMRAYSRSESFLQVLYTQYQIRIQLN